MAVLTWLLAVVAVGWLVIGARTARAARSLLVLGPADSAAGSKAQSLPSPAPSVSIIVAARNEADRLLEASVRSFAEQDYPALEVVAVDDRSTDDTGAILRGLAAHHPRLTVLEGAEPPPGWLGKPHALSLAAAAASGEWLLSTDADVILHPSAVRIAIARALGAGVDCITLIPSAYRGDPWVNVVLPVAAWMIFLLFPPHETADPDKPDALGVGGFLAYRRAALEAVGGHQVTAGDVGDDVALARAFKAHGFRVLVGQAPELVYTPMYTSLRDLWQGFSRSAWRGVGRSLGAAVRSVLLNLVAGVLPAVLAVALAAALLLGAGPGWRPVLAAALSAWLAQALAFVPIYRRHGVSALYSLTAPLAFAVMSGVLANSTWRALTGRGIDWRGRVVEGGSR